MGEYAQFRYVKRERSAHVVMVGLAHEVDRGELGLVHVVPAVESHGQDVCPRRLVSGVEADAGEEGQLRTFVVVARPGGRHARRDGDAGLVLALLDDGVVSGHRTCDGDRVQEAALLPPFVLVSIPC